LTIVEASHMARLNRRVRKFSTELAPFGASSEVRIFKERFRQAVN
jgi:hypothetical protein